jgi:nitronate monooxygenase
MSTSSFTDAEFADYLNRMLETERAGAKALLVYMEDHPRNGPAWKTLRKVQGDEAHNCVLLGDQLKRLARAYSHATGEFFDKAVAVKGKRARIEFLVRGLRWAVREFEQALPRMPDEEVRKVFEGMRASHLRSIAACVEVARALPD